VAAEDSLVTLESDKATMDVPSPAAAVVKEVKVKLGDKVSEGSLIVVLDSDVAGGAAKSAPAASAAARSLPLPVSAAPAAIAPAAAGSLLPHGAKAPAAGPIAGAATYSGKADIDCRMLVLGAGPAATAPRSAPPTSG
jgi:dihydrolipoamide dehydrogenase